MENGNLGQSELATRGEVRAIGEEVQRQHELQNQHTQVLQSLAGELRTIRELLTPTASAASDPPSPVLDRAVGASPIPRPYSTEPQATCGRDNPGAVRQPLGPSLSASVAEWQEATLSLIAKGSAINSEAPIFRNAVRDHPARFLKALEDHFNLTHTPRSEHLNLAKSRLHGSAKDWVEFLSDGWSTYDDFKREFLAAFWSVDQQHEERRRLGMRKYQAAQDGDMASHFLRQINRYRLFSPPLSQDTMQREVMRQYPPAIQSLWALMDRPTLAYTVTFLERQDSIERSQPHSDTRHHLRRRSEGNPTKANTRGYPPPRPPKAGGVSKSSGNA
ncbi:uncharacterized protein LOC123312507 [Coccinella septempunctata]|uniref:uncharacterized protein LOC123312507 n=1 Tax=Coccinella septempunctata TaxID=41139 RepID=UPI001D05D1B3|nr:uncharacterized protein LOC123312507 [Coccinella septempunctata]